MVDCTTHEAPAAHFVELRPGEGLYEAWRRWEATAPSKHCGPVFIR